MATVAELKSRADSLGVTYPSKIRKADLETLIEKASRPARMSNWDRVRNYRAQTGRKNTTARQSRRIRKHDNRAMGRA